MGPFSLNNLYFNSSLPYLLYKGAEKRVELEQIQLKSLYPYDPSSVEAMLLAAAEEAIKIERDVAIEVVDAPPEELLKRSSSYPVWLFEFRRSLSKLEEVLTAPIPRRLSVTHMNRLRFLRALAPNICDVLMMEFDPMLGECVERPRVVTVKETWDLAPYLTDSFTWSDDDADHERHQKALQHLHETYNLKWNVHIPFPTRAGSGRRLVPNYSCEDIVY